MAREVSGTSFLKENNFKRKEEMEKFMQCRKL
jgi:hypothetical protein